MKSPAALESEIVLLALLGVGAFIAVKGIKGAATAAAGAVIDAGGAVVGVVGDVAGQGIGLPALRDITTDPKVARWIIDNPAGGTFEASIWSSASALVKGQLLPRWSGTPPPYGSKIAETFPAYDAPTDTYWPEDIGSPGI